MRYEFSVDTSQLENLSEEAAARARPNISYGVSSVAAAIAARWKNSVTQARLWEGEKRPYFDSIKWEMDGDLAATVSSDYRLASEIETGRPAKDLKTNIGGARKARMVKAGPHAGQKYLIIPFRHNIPTGTGRRGLAPQMPPHVYAEAKALIPSRVLKPGSKSSATRVSATGYLVPQHSYQWGGRLPAGMAPKLRARHVTDPYAGMVRFDTSSGRSKSSAYMTFRVMGEWSDGWVIDPRPGQYHARDAMQGMNDLFKTIIQRALSL